MTTSGRLVRNRYPKGKLHCDSAAAHTGQRKWVTDWQHYHQGAELPTPPEARQHLDNTTKIHLCSSGKPNILGKEQ
jgi:hypothetical protein